MLKFLHGFKTAVAYYAQHSRAFAGKPRNAAVITFDIAYCRVCRQAVVLVAVDMAERLL